MKGANQPERKVPIGGSERWQPIAPNGANLLRLSHCPTERTRSFWQDGSVRTRRIASSPPPRRQMGSGETAGAHRWRKRCLPAELTCGLRRAGTFAAAAQSSANPPIGKIAIRGDLGSFLHPQKGRAIDEKRWLFFGAKGGCLRGDRKDWIRNHRCAERAPVEAKKRPPLSGRPPGTKSVRCGTIRPRQSS